MNDLQKPPMTVLEQRRFERYSPPEGAIAALRPFAEFGVIRNISKGGMAFEYLNIAERKDPGRKPGPQNEIDVFIPGNGNRPLTIPCRIVRVAEKLLGSYAHEVVAKKLCGVEFLPVDRETSMALDAFLSQCGKCAGEFL